MRSANSIVLDGAMGQGTASAPAMDLAIPQTAPAEKSLIAPAPMPPVGATPEERERIGQKIVRNGSVNIRVRQTEDAMNQIKTLAEAKGGFISDSNISAYNESKTGYLTLRIPADKFQETVQAVKAIGTATLEESTQAEDVTAQYVDVDARLRSAKAEEEQYLTILRQAKSIEDTLNVTNRLADVRSRIEQLQGQMRLLSDQTDYATLRVTLTEAASITPGPTEVWSPSETFRQSVRELIRSLQGFISALISGAIFFVGLVLPVTIVVGFITWIGHKLWKKFVK